MQMNFQVSRENFQVSRGTLLSITISVKHRYIVVIQEGVSFGGLYFSSLPIIFPKILSNWDETVAGGGGGVEQILVSGEGLVGQGSHGPLLDPGHRSAQIDLIIYW